jgi:hypothetical protein
MGSVMVSSGLALGSIFRGLPERLFAGFYWLFLYDRIYRLFPFSDGIIRVASVSDGIKYPLF